MDHARSGAPRRGEVLAPPERSIARAPIERPHGALPERVPLLPGADHVALMGVPAAGTAAFAPVAELHRDSLTGYAVVCTATALPVIDIDIGEWRCVRGQGW